MQKAIDVFIKIAGRAGTATELWGKAMKISDPVTRARTLKTIKQIYPDVFRERNIFTGKPSPGTIYRKGKKAIHTTPKITI